MPFLVTSFWKLNYLRPVKLAFFHLFFQYHFTGATIQTILAEMSFVAVIIILSQHQSGQVFNQYVIRFFTSSDI